MTLGNAYDELMEKIEVTDEMRRRILDRVAQADLRKAPRAASSASWKRYAALAACLAVALVGVLVGSRLLRPPTAEQPPVQAVNEIVVCDSAEALSDAVGVPVRQVNALPFEASKTEYRSYWGKLAEIVYSADDGQRAVYRISQGVADNSGDYTDYRDTQTITVDSLPVQLRGDADGYTLACWTDETTAYSLRISAPADADVWRDMLESIGP